MKLKVLGSSSKGNCYILQDKVGQVLILECGVGIDSIKKALNFELKYVRGCLITHEHKDHSKSVDSLINMGVDIYTTKGTANSLDLANHRVNYISSEVIFKLGLFEILPFKVNHDVAEPVGFLIRHPEMGKLLFATDTTHIEYCFKNLNHILCECNYDIEILNKNAQESIIPLFMRKRIIQSHFEFKNFKQFLSETDLSVCENILLLHTSHKNINTENAVNEVIGMTGIPTKIAVQGMELELSPL